MNNDRVQISKAKLATNIIVLLIALYGLAKKDFTTARISFFEQMVIETFAPVQEGTTLLKGKITTFFDNYIFIVNTRKENTTLRKQIKDLEEQIFKLGETDKENKRLKALLRFGEEVSFNKILSQVIARNASSYFKVLRINKGSRDGIKLKSPVVTADGLVGYIYRVSKNYSDILTILDPYNRVDGLITRTRTHGIVEGFKNFTCRMKYVIRTEPIVKGDIITTAGLGNIYPKGIKVGRIKRIEKESYGITQFVVLAPTVDFHRLEEVVVLIKEENKIDSNEKMSDDLEREKM